MFFLNLRNLLTIEKYDWVENNLKRVTELKVLEYVKYPIRYNV